MWIQRAQVCKKDEDHAAQAVQCSDSTSWRHVVLVGETLDLDGRFEREREGREDEICNLDTLMLEVHVPEVFTYFEVQRDVWRLSVGTV